MDGVQKCTPFLFVLRFNLVTTFSYIITFTKPMINPVVPYKEYKIDSRDHFIDRFFKENEDTQGITKKDLVTFFKVLREEITQEVLTNPDGFKMPRNIGLLRMVGIKLKKISVNGKERVKKYKLLRTDNYVFGLYWFRGNDNFRNCKYWKSETGKKIKDQITKAVKEDRISHCIKIEHRNDLLGLRQADLKFEKMLRNES